MGSELVFSGPRACARRTSVRLGLAISCCFLLLCSKPLAAAPRSSFAPPTQASPEALTEDPLQLLMDLLDMLDRDIAAARQHANTHVAWAREHGARDLLGTALAGEAMALHDLEGPLASELLLEEAERIAAEDGVGVLPRASVQLTKLAHATETWGMLDSLYCAQAAVRLAEEGRVLELLPEFRFNEFVQLRRIHTPADVEDQYVELLRTARETDNERLVLRIQFDRVRYLHDEGYTLEARQLMDEIEAEVERLGLERHLGYIQLDRLFWLGQAAEWERAKPFGRRAEEHFRRLGDRRMTASAMHYLAMLDLDLGRLEEVGPRIQRALAHIEGRGFVVAERDFVELQNELARATSDDRLILETSARLAELHDALGSEQNHAEIEKIRHRLAAAERGRHEARSRNQQTLVAGVVGVSVLLCALIATLLVGRKRMSDSNRRLREEVRATREAQAANRLLADRVRQVERLQGLGLIAGGVAHDFNNLLVGVLGNADLLTSSKELNAADRQCVQSITESAKRAADLCKQLLAYAGKGPLNKGPVVLRELVEEILPVLRTSSSGLRLTLEPNGEVVRCLVDPSQLNQVLLNLVTNARDAGASSVRIGLGRRDFQAADLLQARGDHPLVPGSYGVIAVEDDGEGIAAEALDSVFDPFFTTRFPGRGLGLSAVFGIVRRHQGFIVITSEVGNGTRFEVAFPDVPAASDAAELDMSKTVQEEPAALPAAVAGTAPAVAADPDKKVLVVDDEPSVRRLVCTMLECMGREADSAESGEQALTKLAEAPGAFSTVILDVTMPGEDGRKFLRVIRMRAPSARVVLASGHAVDDLLRDQDDLPDAVLAKPFTRVELAEAISGQQVPTG